MSHYIYIKGENKKRSSNIKSRVTPLIPKIHYTKQKKNKNKFKKKKFFKFKLNYGSIFLIVTGILFILIAASPLIRYYIDTTLFNKYKVKIVKADPSASYFQKIITADNMNNNNKFNGYFYLSIPSINLKNIPVKANVDGFNTQAYEHVLVNSLAQMKGTAYPGEYGNIYIYGHSAPQWFADLYPSSFLGIFTNILKLQNGNTIYIKFKKTMYKYKIFEAKVISPTDISVLQSPKGKKWLTLMTCIPPGIGTERYIVKAYQVSKT